MAIHIEITQPQKAAFLIELLQSLDFVSSVTTDAVEPVVDNVSFLQKHNGNLLSSKYWGAWKNNPLSIEKIDFEIRKMREEWDRDIY